MIVQPKYHTRNPGISYCGQPDFLTPSTCCHYQLLGFTERSVCVCAYVCACMYVCVCMCMCMRAHVCVCSCIYTLCAFIWRTGHLIRLALGYISAMTHSLHPQSEHLSSNLCQKHQTLPTLRPIPSEAPAAHSRASDSRILLFLSP